MRSLNQSLFRHSGVFLSVRRLAWPWNVEYHINSGYSETKAIKETASEVRDIWKRTTQIQVSEDKSIIRKIDKVRAARKRTVMENSSRTNKKRFANVKGEGS